MSKGIKEFWNTPIPVLIIKLTLILLVIILCSLSLFLNGNLLGYGMIGVGILVVTYGVEIKIKKQENLTLIFSIFVGIIFLAIAGYIFTKPFV